MHTVLVSACLLGERVRYHSGHAHCDDPRLASWLCQGRVRALCPEVDSGLGVPREPSEIAQGAGGGRVLTGTASVRTRSGVDVTKAFVAGADAAVQLAKTTGARIAVLKEGSPSCGSRYIADGRFAGQRVARDGVTAAALRRAGVAVFNEYQIEHAAKLLALLDSGCGTQDPGSALASDDASDGCI